MEAWNLTARTMMHVDEWKAFFAVVGVPATTIASFDDAEDL